MSYAVPTFFRILKKRVECFLYMFGSISVQSMNSFPYFIPEGGGLEVGHDKKSIRIQFNLNPAPTPEKYSTRTTVFAGEVFREAVALRRPGFEGGKNVRRNCSVEQ